MNYHGGDIKPPILIGWQCAQHCQPSDLAASFFLHAAT
jgi:hypothetical protein